MQIPISPRLLACCNFVHPGDRVADIGCDHGYLGIYLIKKNISPYVIAADIRQMPLNSAKRNAVKFGVKDKISFHLSDGVCSIPQDFDTLVCAGMGGDTMVSILEKAPWLRSKEYRLILQCQSKTSFLRKYLSQQGWHITKEAVLKDGKFLYTIMEVIFQSSEPLTPGQCYFPPALLKTASKHLPEYYQWVIKGLKNIANNRKDQTDPFILQALSELSDLQWLKEKNNENCE